MNPRKRSHPDTPMDDRYDLEPPVTPTQLGPIVVARSLPVSPYGLKKQRLKSPQDLAETDIQFGCYWETLVIGVDRVSTDGLKESQLLRNREIARSVTCFDTLSTIGGERFVRTFHPSFEDTHYVGMFIHPSGYRHWIVVDPSLAPTTAIAGLYVHLRPIVLPPYFRFWTYGDPFREFIDPRKMLADGVLSQLRELFPFAVGCTVYKGGVINIIVPKGEGQYLVEALPTWPGTLGGLEVGTEELNIHTTQGDDHIRDTSAVGQITRSYDDPSSIVPYPHGYRHDLSLVTQEGEQSRLAGIVQAPSPDGVQLCPKFAQPEAALAGSRAFTLHQGDQVKDYGSSRASARHDLSIVQKEVVVEATQYLWQNNQVRRSLLWRTNTEDKSIEEASGSVLCIESPEGNGMASSESQAVLLENFKTPFPFPWDTYMHPAEKKAKAQQTSTTSSETDRIQCCLKGGFFLPDDVKAATILGAHIYSRA
ncbi:hypothetical protein BJ508DRAFT_327949 [Ascobolus immersus RN42]|uniref:Uncharacterized protein n=1 Tax=Ascobolus immersus RN42 TaxID=1160509 RepID=A0A3N4I365_ASCIM|nr:hypothetical protein BJ508DRAFT_327949 [Ascobolus immersus RN42]